MPLHAHVPQLWKMPPVYCRPRGLLYGAQVYQAHAGEDEERTSPSVKSPPEKNLPQRVADYYEKNPHAKLRTAAEALNITQWQLLDAMEGSLSVPAADFGEIYDHLQTLDHVMLHLDTGSVVLQLTTPLPLRKQHGDTVILSRDGLTALVFPENLYAIFLVREHLADQRESLSIALVGEEERIALSIYLCRGENHQIEAISKALFERLWNKYQTNKGETT